MPKRTHIGDEVVHTTIRSQYAADSIPDPWLLQFENEPPGYIHAVKGDLTICYIKRKVSLPVINRSVEGVLVQTGTRTAYIWEQIQ